MERFGRIDVLVNNAANFYGGYFEELTPEQIDDQLATGLVGPMNVTRAVLPVMRRQRSGHILSISSGAGLVGFEFNSAYSAAKFGLEGWMEALQPEVEPFGITTTIVNPGFFRTDLLTPDSANYATPSIDDYADRHAERVQWYQDMNGQQEGDPAKLAQALLTITSLDQPPAGSSPWPRSSRSPSRRPRPCRRRPTPSGSCPAPSPTTTPDQRTGRRPHRPLGPLCCLIPASSPQKTRNLLMKYSVLGSTGMKVSRICLGTATFGVAPTAQDADQLVGAAIDLGINFVDTADVYGNMPVFDRPGAPAAAEREPAEQILGRALRGRRDEMVIATKSNGIVGHNINDRGLSRRHIIRQVETSLRRLETDYIDLYYAHDPDPDTPLEQTLAAYDDLIRQGKIRYVALSNHPAWQVTQALWIADDRRLQAPVATQVKYNLIDRAAERELGPASERFGLSIIPYAPLHGGLLADLARARP